MRFRNARDLERGDTHRCIEALEALLRLNRDVAVRGPWVASAVVASIEIEARGIVLDMLRSRACTALDASLLVQALRRHDDASAPHPLADSLQVEYVFLRSTLHELEHQMGDFAPESMSKGSFARTRGEYLAKMLGPLGTDAVGQRLDAELALMSQDDYRNEIRAANDYYRAAFDLARRPVPEQLADKERLKTLLRKGRFLPLLASDQVLIRLLIARGQAAQRGTLCLAALRHWQFKHTSPPPDLETLLKDAGISKVPIDPFSGNPLKMTMFDAEPVIYSVGPDGLDDKALIEWTGDAQQPGDMIFRLSGTAR